MYIITSVGNVLSQETERSFIMVGEPFLAEGLYCYLNDLSPSPFVCNKNEIHDQFWWGILNDLEQRHGNPSLHTTRNPDFSNLSVFKARGDTGTWLPS